MGLFFGVMDWVTWWWHFQCDCHIDHSSVSCLLIPKFVFTIWTNLSSLIFTTYIYQTCLLLFPKNSCLNKRDLFLSLIESKFAWLHRYSQGTTILQYYCSCPPWLFALVTWSKTAPPTGILAIRKGDVSCHSWVPLQILSGLPNHYCDAQSCADFASWHSCNLAGLHLVPGP